MITLDECEKQGLIRRMPASMRQAEEQMKKAKELLAEAKGAVADKRPNLAVIGGYSAMFGAARSLLFRDGFRERSHACVARFLEVKYKGKIEKRFIDLLDRYRDRRHKVLYGFDSTPTDAEAKSLVQNAEEFVSKIETILKEKPK